MNTEFNADRVLKLVRSDKILQKLYAKHHPKGDRNEAVLKSIYEALIKGDQSWLNKYESIK